MDAPHIDDLVAQVLAWHNGHRLARRIAAHQVDSVGVVALPFVAPSALPQAVRSRWPSWLRRKPEAHSEPAQRTDLVAAFSEDFIAPLTPVHVAQFALRHGSVERCGSAEWPQRDVRPDAHTPTESLTVLFLQTACIVLGKRRQRVLIGPGRPTQVLGARLWSPPRVAGAAAALSTAGVMSVLGAMTLSSEPVSAAAADVALNLPKAVVTTTEPAAEAARVVHPVVAVPAVAADEAMASTEAAAAEPIADAALPIEAAPVATAPDAPVPSVRPQIRPALSAEAREAALREANHLRSLGPVAINSPAPSPLVPPTAQRAHAKAQATSNANAAAAVAVYAVMTPVTRTRAAADLRHQLMGSRRTIGEVPGAARSELMRVGDGWSAVLWPFTTRDEAEAARRVLAERGIRTEVLEF